MEDVAEGRVLLGLYVLPAKHPCALTLPATKPAHAFVSLVPADHIAVDPSFSGHSHARVRH